MFLVGQEAWPPCEECEEVVFMPDPILQVSIRYMIDNPYCPICANDLYDMGATIGLSLPSRFIFDLRGLEYCTSLEWMRFDDNLINDLSPLAGLTNLTALYLKGNRITDIGPLAGLTDLFDLRLDDNEIEDLTPLIELVDPHALYLMNNRISDIAPLVDNPGIDRTDQVHLEGNPLSSTSCTVYIPELESRGVRVYHDCP